MADKGKASISLDECEMMLSKSVCDDDYFRTHIIRHAYLDIGLLQTYFTKPRFVGEYVDGPKKGDVGITFKKFNKAEINAYNTYGKGLLHDNYGIALLDVVGVNEETNRISFIVEYLKGFSDKDHGLKKQLFVGIIPEDATKFTMLYKTMTNPKEIGTMELYINDYFNLRKAKSFSEMYADNISRVRTEKSGGTKKS